MNLQSARLYAILDLGYVADADALRVTRELIEGGVDLLQVRAKNRDLADVRRITMEVHEITADAGVPLIVNDYPKLSRELELEGVHIGQDDGSIAAARTQAGAGAIVGRSTHSLAQAKAAAAEGAAYIGWGPLFATPTKPNYNPISLGGIREVHHEVRVPIFCIGGIKLENLEEVLQAGAQRIVLVSGLLGAPNIAEYARSVQRLLQKFPLA